MVNNNVGVIRENVGKLILATLVVTCPIAGTWAVYGDDIKDNTRDIESNTVLIRSIDKDNKEAHEKIIQRIESIVIPDRDWLDAKFDQSDRADEQVQRELSDMKDTLRRIESKL